MIIVTHEMQFARDVSNKVIFMHNGIIEEAGKIKFKSNNNCIYCLACIQWCPMQAINFGNYNLKDKQYHHPEVVENELFKRW